MNKGHTRAISRSQQGDISSKRVEITYFCSLTNNEVNAVDPVIFVRYSFLQGGQILALVKKNENSQILNSAKSSKIRNSRKFKHTKNTSSTVYQVVR